MSSDYRPVLLDEQLRAALKRAAEISAGLGSPEPGVEGLRRVTELARKHWNEGGPEMHKRSADIPGPHRNIPVVVYRPREVTQLQPVFVYWHGGGFKLGTQWSNDRQMRELAAAWGAVVISADYAHAPESVFPKAVEEAAAVLRWLHDHGPEWGIDGQKIAFGGNSAGASVAFGAALDLGAASWLRAAVSIVGAFSGDPDMMSMQEYGDTGLFPSAAAISPMFDDYLRDADRDDPRINLLHADVSGFPPTFIAAAEFDVLRDASVLMAQRLASAGRLREIKIYPGMAHLFFGFSREVAQSAACVHDIANFLSAEVPAPY